jgi:hypothetical protein
MRKIFGLILLSLPAVVFPKEDDFSLNSSFALWGQFIYMQRSHTYPSNLISTSKSFTEKTSCGCKKTASVLCDSQNVASRFNYEPGFRVGAKYMNTKSVWEASYMSVGEWQGTCHKSQTGLLYFPGNATFNLYDFTRADSADVHYKTWLQYGELNYFRYLTPPRDSYFTFCYLAGLRYSTIKEHLGIFFTRSAATSSYTITAKNQIYGVQTGIGLQCNFTKRFFWDFMAKIGVGYDEVSQKTFLGDYNNTVMIRNYWKTGYSFPLILDGRVKIAYLLDDWIDLHVGYECIYFSGIAEAPNQLVKKESQDRIVRASSEAIYYGLFAGLSINF